MKAISYNGTTFASLNVAAGIPSDLPGPDTAPVLIERYGATPLHAGLGRGARTIPVVFSVLPGYTAETTLMALLAALDPADESERVLAAKLNDGTDVYVNAAMGPYAYLAVNQVQVLFTATDPAWKKTARAYSPGSAVTNYTAFTANGSQTITNTGQTAAQPVVRLKWTGTNRTTSTANFGYLYRRTITVTNNSTRTLRRYPLQLDLDDTKAWVTAGKALASGNDIRVFHNGRELPRTLFEHNVTLASGTTGTSTSRTVITLSGTPLGATNYAGYQFIVRGGNVKWESAEIASNTNSSVTLSTKLSAIPDSGLAFRIRNCWCWTVVDEIQPGATVTLEVVYGNPNADTPPTLTGADAAAFDLAKSSNMTWQYKLSGSGKSASATSGRGLWYASPVGREVNALSWDVPGAWSRLNYLDNRDDRTQLRVSRVGANHTTTTSGSTTTLLKIASTPNFATNQWAGARAVVTISGAQHTRYVVSNTTDELTLGSGNPLPSAPNSTNAVVLSTNVGRFDARRTWQDNAQYPEEGAYDGVMLSHPLGIRSVQGAYSLTNPASIAKFVIVSRASGAEDWAKDVEAATATASTAIDLDWESGTYPVQVGMALSANDDVVIPTSYAKDSGTATAATGTTMTDANKAWATSQWVDGYIKIVGGKGKGQRRQITASTATQVTVATWTTTPDDTSRYILTADHKASAALVGNYLTVTVDGGSIAIGDISSEAAVFDTGKGNSVDGWLQIRSGGGAGATTYPHHLVRIGGAGKRLFIPTNGILRIDTANRTVRLYDSSEVTYTSVPWAVDFYKVTAEGTARSSEWLPVRKADSTLYLTNPVWNSLSLSLEADIEEAFLG